MNIYTFKSLGMLGQMYVGGEEVNDVNGCDFYRVEDVARERAEYASKLDEMVKAAELISSKDSELRRQLASAHSRLEALQAAVRHYLDNVTTNDGAAYEDVVRLRKLLQEPPK